MADIELVIKIPEEVMEYIRNNSCLSVVYNDEVTKAMKNGVPLPKGHGRLIDADELREKMVSYRYSDRYCENHTIERSISIGMVDLIINDASTVIEADKEQTNETDCD